MRVAAFDVGTNTILCLVADVGEGSLAVVQDGGEITGLGRGALPDGTLAPAPLERARDALLHLAAQARALGAQRLVGVGTSALREAPNREEFAALARETLDRFEVITGEREAELTFAGALPGLDLGSADFTVVDIGGGSTEIARADGARVSLPLGTIRLLERHLRSDPPSPEQVRALCLDVDQTLAAAAGLWSGTVVALAGTALGVASVATLDHYDPARAHGQRLSPGQIRETAERLTRLGLRERRALPGMPAGREDVLVAGAWLLSRIAVASGAAQVIASTGGVRYGLAAAL